MKTKEMELQDPIETVERTAHYPIMNIVKCMRLSAMMLEIADGDNPNYSKLNQMQANLLRAAARDLAAQYEAQLAEIKKIAESFLAGPSMSFIGTTSTRSIKQSIGTTIIIKGESHV